MGKVKTVVMGDEIAEEAAREKAAQKRAAKKQQEKSKSHPDAVDVNREEKKAEKNKTEHLEDVTNSPTEQEVEKFEEKNEEIIKETKKTSKKKAALLDNYHFNQGKKYLSVSAQVDKNKIYSLSEAIDLTKKTSYSKFDGTVELHINVSDKGLRGIVTLPHGTGKQVRVAIADDALINSVSSGGPIDFDILVSSPDMMPKLARIAKILGPKGLMPNPKTGTIGPNPEKLVESLSKGQVQWKTENDFPIIHAILGKVSFEKKKLEENFLALTKSIGKDKIVSLFMKATMGPSIKVQI